jgi:hypothetical protein
MFTFSNKATGETFVLSTPDNKPCKINALPACDLNPEEDKKYLKNLKTMGKIKDQIVRAEDIKVGLRVVDDEGCHGIVYKCDNMHDVVVLLDGRNSIVDIDGIEIECGGCGLYCFVDGCEQEPGQDILYFEEL